MRKTTIAEHESESAPVYDRIPAWKRLVGAAPSAPSKPAVTLPEDRKEADKVTRAMRGGKQAFLTGNTPRFRQVRARTKDIVEHKGTCAIDAWGVGLIDARHAGKDMS